MSIRIITSLSLATVLALALAFWAYRSGAGAVMALLVYSLGGSTLTVLFAAVSVFYSGFDTDDPDAHDRQEDETRALVPAS